MKTIALILITLLTITSCSHNKDEKLQKKLNAIWSEYYTEDFNQTKNLNILVVTNRKSKNNDFGCSNDSFGAVPDSVAKFGICQISVPKNHAIGEINLAKDNRQSSNDFFKISSAKSLQETDLINFLKKSDRTALIFVHGFNVQYQEAVLRAAQIAYDLKYQGPVILFTWPAGAGGGFFDESLMNKTYTSNLNNAKNSISVFQNFLIDLAKNNIRANLIVHSMGHQVVLPALDYLGKEKPKTHFVNELILNAPDFDMQEFNQAISNIKKSSKHITLYCSKNDKAMIASKTFNNGSLRVGACGLSNDLDNINVSLVDNETLGLGHGYYSSREILSDVSQALLGVDVKKRLFIKKSEPFGNEKYFLR